MQRRNPVKRSISLLLAVLMVLQCGHFVMPVASAADSATATGDVLLGDVELEYNQTLKDNGDGSFSLTLELDVQTEHKDSNEDALISRNGYFTAPADGKYLVQLWGGTGGNGEKPSGLLAGNNAGEGGAGGAGGYVYGIVSLKKGETLFYQLGGNGSQTQGSGTGGGVNGDGGDGGSITLFTVGGGGGYSAIYKYGVGEFESGYFTADGEYNGNSVSEADRVSRYIMIAGGGGGGGAGSGTFLASDQGWAPNGGAAGNMGSTAVSVSGGTVFVGSNGSSSSTNTEYVGQGGTDVPGVYSSTWVGVVDTEQANDWAGITNPDLHGGSGGSCNLRGGAGGAGYAGGSGGIMTSVVVATAVGGGGGGSSFVADSVDYQSVDSGKLSDSPDSSSGGSIVIRALEVDTSYLESVNIDFKGTKYFSVEVDSESGVATSITSESDATTSCSVSSANMKTKDPLTITVKFTPKEGFAGGNNVPLVVDDLITITAGEHTANIYVQPECGYVNVPLKFKVSLKETQTYYPDDNKKPIPTVAGMYTDNYDDVRGNLAGKWQYDFIASIGEYVVTDPNGTVLDKNGNVTPDVTTKYPVSFTVTPKSGAAAAVGEPVSTQTFTGNAEVRVVLSDQLLVDGKIVTYGKTLIDNGDNTFTLSLNVKASASQTSKKSSVPPNVTIDPITENKTVNIKYSGWYYIQAWGGNGGKGGDASTTFKESDGKQCYSSGGTGGVGKYLGGYLYLKAGDTLVIGVEPAAEVSDDDLNVGGDPASACGEKGYAGGSTTVLLKRDSNDTGLIVAGGGGGGGAGWRYDRTVDYGFFTRTDRNGKAATGGDSATVIASSYSDAISVTASDGGVVTPGNHSDRASGGTAGSSYIHTADGYLQTTSDTFDLSEFVDNRTWDAGRVVLTCLKADPASTVSPSEEGLKTDVTKLLQNYTLDTEISKYFDVTDVTITNGTGTSAIDNTTGKVKVTGINPTVTFGATKTNTDETQTVTGSIDFTVNIKLTPKDGFLGGNDVPVLAYGEPNSTDATTSMLLGQNTSTAAVPRQNESDFVNVTIPGDAADGVVFNVKTPAPKIIKGGSVERNDLYTVTGFEKPTGGNAWKADFVDFTQALTYEANGKEVTEDPLAPTETTYYVVTCTVGPKAEPAKATNAKVAAVSKSVGTTKTGKDTVVIYVLPVIEYVLTDVATNAVLDANNTLTIQHGVDHEAVLTPADTYVLPDSITVTRTGEGGVTTLVQGTDYSYSPSTGAIRIDKAAIGYDHITIYAEGIKKEPLSITYYYMTDPNSSDMKTKVVEGFMSGEELNDSNVQMPQEGEGKDYTVPEGYTYNWTWGNGGTTHPATITENLYVIGSYIPEPCTLTIQCKDEVGNVLTTLTKTVLYGSEYFEVAPNIAQYAPIQTVITGKMDNTEGKTIVFTYRKTTGQLNILYLYEDGTKAKDPYSQPIELGKSYSITSLDDIIGYSPDSPVVTIESVTQDQVNNGITKIVTYKPEQYQIYFNPAGGSCDTTPHTVEYHNRYSYDPKIDGPAPLPVPVRPGYNFGGWYLEDGVTRITDNTVVEITEDSTLVAHWTEIEKFTLTIKYVYKDGTVAAPAYSVKLAPGEEYSEASPVIAGFTPDYDTVSGTMGKENRLITVTYTKNTRTLTVEYRYGNGALINLSQLPGVESNPIVVELLPTATYEPKVPTIAGYTSPSADPILMGPEDKTVILYYTEEVEEEVVSVTIEWGTLTFNYKMGMWQPESHTYEDPTIEPSKEGYNTITVTNGADSNVPVSVAIRYEYYSGHDELEVHFTSGEYPTSPSISEWTLAVEESKRVYLWLSGRTDLPDSVVNPVPVGLCIVTITSVSTGGG